MLPEILRAWLCAAPSSCHTTGVSLYRGRFFTNFPHPGLHSASPATTGPLLSHIFLAPSPTSWRCMYVSRMYKDCESVEFTPRALSLFLLLSASSSAKAAVFESKRKVQARRKVRNPSSLVQVRAFDCPRYFAFGFLIRLQQPPPSVSLLSPRNPL